MRLFRGLGLGATARKDSSVTPVYTSACKLSICTVCGLRGAFKYSSFGVAWRVRECKPSNTGGVFAAEVSLQQRDRTCFLRAARGPQERIGFNRLLSATAKTADCTDCGGGTYTPLSEVFYSL